MGTALEDLRNRLAELPMHGGKRQYTADVKRRVLSYIAGRIADGTTESAACKDLGMHQATIAVWTGRKKTGSTKKTAASRVRAVEVVAVAPEQSRRTLVLPGGAHVDGLSLADVVAVAKALR